VVRLDRVAHRAITGDFVFVLAASPVAGQVALFLEVGDDALHGALGDADACGDLAQPEAGVLRQAEQDVTVVGEERPPGRCVRLSHAQSIDTQVVFSIARIKSRVTSVVYDGRYAVADAPRRARRR